MANLLSYDALLFPADGRTPHLVTLSASPVTEMDVQTGQLVLMSVLPHPEVHMDLIADNNRAARAWRFQVCPSHHQVGVFVLTTDTTVTEDAGRHDERVRQSLHHFLPCSPPGRFDIPVEQVNRGENCFYCSEA